MTEEEEYKDYNIICKVKVNIINCRRSKVAVVNTNCS